MGGSPGIEDHAPVFGAPAFAVDLECEVAPDGRAPGSILIGLDRRGVLPRADLGLLDNPHELAVAAKLGEFPEVVEAAARELAPHVIAFYLKDLAAAFHSYYNAERMLVEDAALKDARVALAAAVRQVIRNGMAIIGVSCPQSM